MFLAVDSSLGTSVAVVSEKGVILAEHSSADRRAHAETIGVLLQGALQEASITPQEVSAVVMGVGPGPYTGLRVGMAAAQAFALSRAVPLYPVVSHDAPGWASDSDCVVITDARRGEVAYSIYHHDASKRRVLGPQLAKPEDLDEVLGEHRRLPRLSPDTISAAGLARVALAYRELALEFPGQSPLYLRQPDVTVKP